MDCRRLLTFAIALVCLLATASMAATVPITRAMRVDPVVALKTD